MTIETKKTKREIERDLAGAQNAQEMVGQLQQVASHVKEHEAALKEWEEAGGWSRRETQAKIEAESITRQIHDKQSEMLPLLRELEQTPLFKLVGLFYRVQELRGQLLTAAKDINYTRFQRDLAIERENSASPKLDYHTVNTIATPYQEESTRRLVDELDPGYHPLRGIPEGKSQAIANLCLNLAYPAKRIPQNMDTNMGIASRVPQPVEGIALHPGPVMAQQANSALGLTGKTQGKEQTGLFRSVSKRPLFHKDK